jgi:hypothetical protein
VWVSQLGPGDFRNLTRDLPPLMTPGNLLRSLGFDGDGSQIWFNPSGNPGREKVFMPLDGGARRPFLPAGRSAPAWSPENDRVVYIGSNDPGDPMWIADRIGADPLPIIPRGASRDNWRFSSLVTGITNSLPFRMRMARTEDRLTSTQPE